MTYDLAVIGAGPGGYTGAIRAAQLGLKTCIIEKDKTLGGTCLNVGCIPSKALLDSSEHYSFALDHIKDHGVQVGKVQLDLAKMMKRKEKIVSELTYGVNYLMKKNKIERIQGTARITGASEVQIDGRQTITAKNILIATGSRPRPLPFAPFNQKNIISSTEALSLNAVPKTLIVIGGGYIGLELGSVWHRLGSQVHVIEFSPVLCPALDQDISQALYKTLKNQGLKFYLNSKVTEVKSKSSSHVEVKFETAEGASQKLTGNIALVSIGRVPYYDNLGLKELGIQTDPSGICVNDKYQTSIPSIYAIGDVIAGPMLAHKAEEEGVAAAEIMAKGVGHVNYKTVPSVVYTWPEAAGVGLSQQEAEKSFSVKIGKFPFSANGRAKALAWTQGFVKIVADKETDEVLGVHIIGPRASDMIAEAVTAMEFQAVSEDIARSFHAHPTLSEVMREAALDVHSAARQM